MVAHSSLLGFSLALVLGYTSGKVELVLEFEWRRLGIGGLAPTRLLEYAGRAAARLSKLEFDGLALRIIFVLVTR